MNKKIRALWSKEQKEMCDNIILYHISFEPVLNANGIEITDTDFLERCQIGLKNKIIKCFFRLSPFHFALWMFLKYEEQDFLADSRFWGNEIIDFKTVTAMVKELQDCFDQYADCSIAYFLKLSELEDEDETLEGYWC